MATNWNAVLANINNASDILAILRKVLGLLDGKVDLTKIDEIIADISNMQTNVDTALTNVNSALSEFDTEAQEAIQQVIAAGLMEGFVTEAELLATRPLEPKKYAKAEDTDVIWFWNKPDGSPDGSYWTSTGLSEYNRAINFINANPLFKPIKIVAGDDFNNFTKQGIYYHWGANLSSTQVVNGPLYIGGNLSPGVLVVVNPAQDGSKSTGCTQTFYSYADGYAPFYRKVSQATNDFPSTWDSHVTRSTQYTYLTPLTDGQDVLQLTAGRYIIPSIAIGNSLVNMPSNVPYKFGRIEVDYTANSSYKIVRFIPYGRDSNKYENKNYELNVWTGWRTFKDYETLKTEFDGLYTSQTALAAAVASALNNVTQNDFFGRKYTVGELSGTSIYSNAVYAGFNQVTTKAVSFNSVKARIWSPAGGNESIEYRVYFGSKVTAGANGVIVPQANVNTPDYVGHCKFFPTIDTTAAQDIELDQVVYLPANTPFVIIFRKDSMSTLRIAHATSVSGNLDLRGFSMWAVAQEWGTFQIAVATPSAPLNYVEAGFQLLLKLPNSGDTPTPIQPYIPEVFLPPKIYVMEGLEANIFLENTMIVDHNLYDFDFSCSKGMQKRRGWRFTPTDKDALGTYSLSLAVVDKYTSAQLASASSQVIIVSKNANSGITKKVQVIGDSRVAAGSITQGLLNNASTDVMGITLIGTRGTGLNKHEGRGGWTINDYTTVGRTYYLFTVSGVTTAPAINSTIYTFNGGEFTVQETNLSSGSGTLLCSYTGTAPTNGATGTLNKKDAGMIGDSTIAFSNVQSQSGNPFWNAATSTVDYQNYLTTYGLQTPDDVIISLGVNDTFSFTSDQAVINFTTTGFPKLDTLINSILAVNSTIRVAISSPPTYASQDAFGYNYACGQTSRRAKRNIGIFNKLLSAYYSGKEASRIFFVGAGANVDTENNYPESPVAVNSRNPKTVIEQTNGVHSSVAGYYQEPDVFTPYLKSTV